MNPAQNKAKVSAARGTTERGTGYHKSTNEDGPGRGVCTSGRDLSRLLRSRPVAHIPPREYVEARREDAPVRAKLISQELADLLAPRIMRSTERRGRCWIRDEGWWRPNGYTYISRRENGKTSHYLAHRVVYVHYFGLIPEGLTIDHTCERRACVNPKHLQAVTHRQNVLCSRTNPYAIRARNARERNERADGAA